MKSLWRALDSLVMGRVDRAMEREQHLVMRPERARKAFLQDVATFLVVMAMWIVYVLIGEGVVHTLLGVAIGAYIGTTALRWTVRASAYKHGWIDGRHSMIAAMSEAFRRGLTLEEWLEGEYERDMTLMYGGVPRDDGPDDA